MTPYRPALAEGVELRPHEVGGELYDPLFDRTMQLGEFSFAVARGLDGTRALPELAALAAADGEPDEARAEHVVRTLLLLLAVSGSGEATRARVRRLRAGDEKLAFRVLDEARFACQGSGECCQNYAFGPLDPADAARLAALDLAAAFPHLASQLGEPPYWEERRLHRDGRVALYLKTLDTRCAFLDPDLRCGIHARFGAEAKPGFCRLYPLESLATIDGHKVYDKGSCASFGISARAGEPLAEALPRFAGLLGSSTLHHPTVVVPGGGALDYSLFLRFADAACDLVARGHGDAVTTLRACGRLAEELFGALVAVPIAVDEPERTLVAQLDRPAAALYAPRRSIAQGGETATAHVAAALLEALAPAIAVASYGTILGRAPTPSGALLTERLAREASHVLHVVLSVASHRADPDRLPLDEWIAPLTRQPDNPEFEALHRLSLRQQLFGHCALVDDRPLAGLLRLALSHLVTTWGARLHAAGEGRPAATIADFNFGHTLAARILSQGSCEEVFIALEPLAPAVLDALPDLV